MLLLQNILYCLLFILMVKCLVRNDGMNCVYFYPKEYIEEADKRGLIDKDAVMKKGKQVMIPFCIILFVVLIAIILSGIKSPISRRHISNPTSSLW